MTRSTPILLLALLAAPALSQSLPEDAIRDAMKGPLRINGSQTAGQVMTWDGTAWVASDAAGGSLSSVSTTGSGLSGDGTEESPLALAAVLEALVDGGGTATAGAGTVLDLSTTGGLAFGTSGLDPRLVRSTTDTIAIRDGSGGAGSLDIRYLAFSGNLTPTTPGSAGSVSYRIANDADTGIYGTADTRVSTSIGGTRYLNVTTAGISANGAVLSEGGGTAASVVLGIDNSTANGFYGNAGSDLGVSVGGKARHSWGQTRTLTDASATTVCTVGLASGEAVGVLIDYTITATSGSDIQVRTGRVIVPIRDASGSATGTATDDSQAEVSTGTLTASWTVADGTNAAVIQCNADSSLSTPTVTVHYEIALTGANPTLTLP